MSCCNLLDSNLFNISTSVGVTTTVIILYVNTKIQPDVCLEQFVFSHKYMKWLKFLKEEPLWKC